MTRCTITRAEIDLRLLLSVFISRLPEFPTWNFRLQLLSVVATSRFADHSALRFLFYFILFLIKQKVNCQLEEIGKILQKDNESVWTSCDLANVCIWLVESKGWHDISWTITERSKWIHSNPRLLSTSELTQFSVYRIFQGGTLSSRIPLGVYLATKIFMYTTWFVFFWPYILLTEFCLPTEA